MILVFDGHVWNMKLLDPDVFTSFSLASLTELPAAILLALFLDRWGRRWMGFASMFICGVFSFVAIATPAGKLHCHYTQLVVLIRLILLYHRNNVVIKYKIVTRVQEEK